MALINRKEVLQELEISPQNMGSASAQIVVLTEHIELIAEHLRSNKKDHAAHRALMCLLGKRRAMLKYCASKNSAMYQKVLKALGLRR
ncbi:MAG: 30S ribosomal protein S15 [Alphaproteobacteria bacterium]|nr:30S ribosomal protein S15 [Alphaproteobacteria bacterium]